MTNNVGFASRSTSMTDQNYYKINRELCYSQLQTKLYDMLFENRVVTSQRW